jgi:HSF-type DNA-binding
MYFKATKFTSFTRKLNRWGFNRAPRGPETGAYFHKLFRRDKPDLVMQMTSNSGSKIMPSVASIHQQNAAAMMSTVLPTAMGQVPMPMFQYAANPMMFTTQQQLMWQQQMMLYGHQMQMMQLQMQQQQHQQQQPQRSPGLMTPGMASPQPLLTSPIMGMGMQSPMGMMPGMMPMMPMPMPGMSPMMPSANQMSFQSANNNEKADDQHLHSPIVTSNLSHSEPDSEEKVKVERI